MARMLVVVAHPDDETFGTGSVIANAAAAGHEVIVCCATRGEAGEDISGTTSSPEELARIRTDELHAAARVMGASDVVLWEFADSGFDGEMPADGLAAVPMDDVIARIAALIAEREPDVVVSLDYTSVNDHRDHQRIGEAAALAFHQAAKPGARLYLWTLARSIMDRWFAEMRAKNLLPEYADLELGVPDDTITTIVDVAHVAETRKAAIAQHRTQQGPFAGISPELFDAILAYDYLIRVVPPWDGGPVEHTLFG